MDRKILVIDDESSTRNLLADFLTIEGFFVLEATNGQNGVQQIQAHQPDLILCDLNMPHLNGYGVLKYLRDNPDTAVTPFVFLTGRQDWTEQRQAMTLGADDYIVKPFELPELRSTVVNRLAYHDRLKQHYTPEPSPAIHNPRFDDWHPNLPSAPEVFQFPDRPQLKPIFEFVETHYAETESTSLRKIAQKFGYSPSYLTSLVRRLTGQTLYQWIVHRRMFAARQLLLTTSSTICQIAIAVGYTDTSHFVKHFRQLHEQPPQSWREQIQQGSN